MNIRNCPTANLGLKMNVSYLRHSGYCG